VVEAVVLNYALCVCRWICYGSQVRSW